MDRYCVQEDWPAKTARVHHADCRYCNNGPRLPAWSYRAEQRTCAATASPRCRRTRTGTCSRPMLCRNQGLEVTTPEPWRNIFATD